MFGHRYFGLRYFGNRYFPQYAGGGSGSIPGGTGGGKWNARRRRRS